MVGGNMEKLQELVKEALTTRDPKQIEKLANLKHPKIDRALACNRHCPIKYLLKLYKSNDLKTKTNALFIMEIMIASTNHQRMKFMQQLKRKWEEDERFRILVQDEKLKEEIEMLVDKNKQQELDWQHIDNILQKIQDLPSKTTDEEVHEMVSELDLIKEGIICGAILEGAYGFYYDRLAAYLTGHDVDQAKVEKQVDLDIERE